MTVISATPLTEERFRAIVEAYGAEPERWPASERASAAIFARDHADFAQPLLDEARSLDQWLDAASATDAAWLEDADAHARAVAGFVEMDSPIAAIVPLRPRRPMPVLWATGVAVAACLAGAVFGVNISKQSLGDLRAQSVLEQTQMVDAESMGEPG